MTTEPLIPVIDYTSRDYLALRADMIRAIRARIPQWTADNPSDFGLALVEAFAYSVDTIHYYLDRVANEAYLSTAVQRESLYSIAHMFGYSPQSASPASVELEFTNSTSTRIVVPVGTRCQATIQSGGANVVKNFETDEEIVLPPSTAPGVTTAKTKATEGRTYYEESIGVSTGFVGQEYKLPRTSVLAGTVRITTEIAGATVDWVEYDDLELATPFAYAFQVIRNTDGSSVVRFGDGLHGAIPDLHSLIRATYRVGGGTAGNVAPYSVSAVIEPVIYGLSVTNRFAATGGENAESLEMIRINAARKFRSRDRAVTMLDFVALAESATGMAKAKTVGNNNASVTVYVVPESDAAISVTPPVTTLTDSQRLSVATFLEERAMAGVTIQVFGPSWETIHVRMDAYLLQSAQQESVETLIRNRLAALFSFNNVRFNQVITVQSILSELTGIPGLDYVEVTGLDLDPAFPVVPNQSPTKALDIGAVTVKSLPFWDDDYSLELTLFGGISRSDAA